MKSEFWAAFDLYWPLTGLGKQIAKLDAQIVKSKDKQKKKSLEKQKHNRQEKCQQYIVKFLFQGELPESLGKPWLDPAARQAHLAQLLAVDCICKGKSTQCKDYAKDKNGLQRWYYAGDLQNPRGDYQRFLCQRLRWMGDILGFANYHETVGPDFPDLSLLPSGSWAIQVLFILKKPYLSKDEVDFYIIDNPVKKEWVFKVPYVAPSQWKGALRAAMRRLKGYTVWEEEGKDQQMIRLFGNVKGETEEFTSGSLYFYPTFFDRIGLEVINPHDRKTGVGKQPIYFECVPAGTPGIFTLLYVPTSEVDEETSDKDFNIVRDAIEAMLTKYGFGAKTSSGYGMAEICKMLLYTIEGIKYLSHTTSPSLGIVHFPKRLGFRVEEWKNIIRSKKDIILKEFAESWKTLNISFEKPEPEIIKEYLTGGGINKLNQTAQTVLSKNNFVVKFAGVFVHQSPKVKRITSNDQVCEIGDWLVVSIWMDPDKEPQLILSYLYQVKKFKGDYRMFKVTNECQRRLYDEDDGFLFYSPRKIFKESHFLKMPIRCWGFKDTHERGRGLKYFIISPKDRRVYPAPLDLFRTLTFSEDLVNLLLMNTGIPIELMPSINEHRWSAINLDIIRVTAAKKTPWPQR